MEHIIDKILRGFIVVVLFSALLISMIVIMKALISLFGICALFILWVLAYLIVAAFTIYQEK